MPRVKNADTWIFTYSPQEDVTEIPEEWKIFFESEGCKRAYVIAEKAEKWHIHAGFETSRSFNSDYKWWKAAADEWGYKEPAIDIRYHNNISGLVGGYCCKEENTKHLYNKGFTNKMLEYGQREYERGLRRQRVKKFLDKHFVINGDKWDAAIGAEMAELDCDRSEAICALAQDGWTFAKSQRGFESLYQDKYVQDMHEDCDS